MDGGEEKMMDPNMTDDKMIEIDRLLISSLLFIKITNRKNRKKRISPDALPWGKKY
ncbi:hypothetical protein IC801_17735 [Geobacillus sp. 44B]|nr:hypothetical protein IC801_17735 [Geobacillus sp. 44B]BDG42985.1 hypothetical protein PcaKH35_13300 [Parageobacillus caldoxylosilyticus]